MMKIIVNCIMFCLAIPILCGCRNTSSEQVNEKREACQDTTVIDACETDAQMLTLYAEPSKSKIPGTDSIISYSIRRSADSTQLLFHIVKGGNIECIADSIIHVNDIGIALFTIADYSQEGQIFYILYDIAKDSIFQSARVNLPSFDNPTIEHNSLSIDHLSADSIYIGGTDTKIAIESMHLDCDSNRIINYYEYQ